MDCWGSRRLNSSHQNPAPACRHGERPVRSNEKVEVCRVPLRRDAEISLVRLRSIAIDIYRFCSRRTTPRSTCPATSTAGAPRDPRRRRDDQRPSVLVREADEVDLERRARRGRRCRGLGRVAVGAVADRCTQAGASHLTVGAFQLRPRRDRLLPEGGLPVRRRSPGLLDTYPMAVVETASAPATW